MDNGNRSGKTMKNLIKGILKRMTALVILKVSGVLAAGSIAGMEIWQSALVAAFVGVMEVTEDLARGYVNDGTLTDEEVNNAFNQEEF